MQHTKNDGLTSVVGEMLLLGIVIILVSLVAMSAFNLLPGERETITEVVMEYQKGTNNISFWHKGGDWVLKQDLRVTLNSVEVNGETTLTNWEGKSVDVFDLGGCYTIKTDTIPVGEIRLVTTGSILYSGRIT